MSGFEIAGLILGSYPLLVTAVAVYNETKSGKGARRLVLNLKTQEAIFHNSIRRLLAPPIISEADSARLTDPAHPDLDLWKDTKLKEKLKARLGRENASIVVEILGEIYKLLCWFHDELKYTDHAMVTNPLRKARLFYTDDIIVERSATISWYSSLCQAFFAALRRPKEP